MLAEKLDALAIASADVTVLYVGLTLATGMLWGRPVWGIWWAWDARLTSVLLLFLLYVSYLLVRRFSTDGNAPVVGAVISIFAGIDVPIRVHEHPVVAHAASCTGADGRGIA